MSTYTYPPVSSTIAGGATSAKQDDMIVLLTEIEADQDTGNASLDSIDTKVSTAAKQDTANASLAVIESDTTSIDSKITACDTTDVKVTVSALPAGAATSSKQDDIIAAINTSANTISPVDFLDAILLDASVSNIPASASLPLEVIASAADNIVEIEVNDTTGYLIGIYTGAASSEILHTTAILGGGSVKVNIPSGTRVSLRALENSAITVGTITFNCLG